MADVTSRVLPPAVPATSLRVFEPVDAFPAESLARWERWLARDDATARAEEAERRQSWLQLVHGAGPPGPNGHVRVLRVGNLALLCPLPEPAGETGPNRSLIRAWNLPVAWLLLAAPSDRPGQPGYYLVQMARARARAARALRTLRLARSRAEPGAGLTAGAGPDRRPGPSSEPAPELTGDLGGAAATGPTSELTTEVELVARWLESFHPRSWLELDARPVAALVDGEDGVEDVLLGLECLADGDPSGVAAAHKRLTRRSERLLTISRRS